MKFGVALSIVVLLFCRSSVHAASAPQAIRVAYTSVTGNRAPFWIAKEAKLFEKQGEWGEKHGHGAPATPVAPPDAMFQKYAQELGMNVEQLKISINDPKHAAKVDRDMRDVDTLKVMRTPTFYVNGRLLARLNQQDLRTLIKEEFTR